MADLSVYGKLRPFAEVQNEARKNSLATALLQSQILAQQAQAEKASRPSMTDMVNEAALRAAQGNPQPGDEHVLNAYGALHPRSNVGGLAKAIGGSITSNAPKGQPTTPQDANAAITTLFDPMGNSSTQPFSSAAVNGGAPAAEPVTVQAPKLPQSNIPILNAVRGMLPNAPSVTVNPSATAPAKSSAASPEALSGDDFLRTLPVQRAKVVKLIGDGAERSATILARLPGSERMAIMADVATYNPNYNANQLGANKAFEFGTQGNQIRSFNTAISHLDSLRHLADALENNDIKLFNRAANFYEEQTGSAAPTSFDAAKLVVAQEITKAIVANGGSMSEREEAADNISRANSPAQLKGVIDTYTELMRGQLDSLRIQYKSATNRDDFDKKLSPAALKAAKGSTPATVSDIRKIPTRAVKALKSDPSLADEFDAKFGQGAAAAVMRGR